MVSFCVAHSAPAWCRLWRRMSHGVIAASPPASFCSARRPVADIDTHLLVLPPAARLVDIARGFCGSLSTRPPGRRLG
jgi:hypothetical protein